MTAILGAARRQILVIAIAAAVLAAALFTGRDLARAGVTPPPGDGIDVVYIALGTNFPDALGAAALGGVNGAPVLLVPTNPPIPAPIEAELIRLDPEQVVIVGGTGVISQAMEDAIEALLPNAGPAERLAGADRYATSALLSQSQFPLAGTVSVPGVAFTSTLPATDSVNLTPGAVYGAVTLYAPVNLPDGAEIIGIVARVTDTDGSDGIGVRLRALGFNTNAIIADAFSGDAYSGGQLSMADFSIDGNYETVDNALFSYFLEVYASGATRSLIDVQIAYRVGRMAPPS